MVPVLVGAWLIAGTGAATATTSGSLADVGTGRAPEAPGDVDALPAPYGLGEAPELGDFGAEQAVFDEETPLVTGASRRRQTLAEVPGSVTVVTGDQIRIHGWDSLGEILSHVRGFYVADDLNYEYLGVRGFMRPGDYNSRVLVLVDGHPLNDPVFLAASIGREVIEPTRIERVEVVRGPGSALYGSSALLGVVNIVTRTGPDPRTIDGVGVELSLSADSLGRGSASVGFDRWLPGDTRVALSVRLLGALGERYRFPELGIDAPTARADDRERGFRVYGRVEHGPLSVVVGLHQRDKRVPTASYGTLPSAVLETQDRELYASAQLQLEPAPGVEWSSRIGVTSYHYYGLYPYAVADGGDLDDYAVGTQLTLESTLIAELDEAIVVHVGASAQRSFALDTWSEYASAPPAPRDLGYGTLGIFVDLQLRLLPSLSLYVGGRLDAYQTFGSHASPRVAVVAEPWSGMVLRAGYGTAFRAPNAFELYYVDVSRTYVPPPAQPAPERLEQLEASAEQALFGGAAHVGVAVFRFHLMGIIEGVADDQGAITFANVGTARTIGGELWADARLPVLDTHVELSYTAADARDVDSGTQLSASPLHTFSGSTDFSLGIDGLRLGAAVRYVGQRRGVDPSTVIPGALITDVTASWRDVAPGFDVAIGLQNALDTRWFVPGGLEHTQSKLPQEGVSGWVRLSSVF